MVYLDPVTDLQSGSRKAKMTHKNRKKVNKFQVLDVIFWRRKGSPVAWTFFVEA
jgi:hypothetical protein